MRIGIRQSPHLDAIVEGIRASGDTFTSEYDGGADYFLCWGWPQGEQIAKDLGGRAADIICLDAHPFALRAGDKSGDRIIQLGNWGFCAAYPPVDADGAELVRIPRNKAKRDGPILVLGHVASTEQLRQGLVDVWYTPGGDAWLAGEIREPRRKFRPHPRMWLGSTKQPTLEEDLEGCSSAVAWNSTATVHARLLGYPSTSIEAHGWSNFDLDVLAALRVSPRALRSGEYWRDVYRPWLISRISARRSEIINDGPLIDFDINRGAKNARK